MRFKMHGCGPRGFDFPAGLLAMGFGPRGGGWGQGWSGWDGDWGGRGGRRGRRRVFEPGELKLVLLKLIADQPRHGYDLIRAIEEITHGTYAPSPGVVYPTLTMLQDMGLIEETKAGEDAPRKAYAATEEGRTHLADKAEEVEVLLGRLENMGNDQRKAGGAPIKRAVGNLLSALWHRVTRDEADEQTLHDIAAILDEAAQKIERLKSDRSRPEDDDRDD